MTYRDIIIDHDACFDDLIDDRGNDPFYDPSHYTYVFINGEPIQLGIVEIDD